MALYRCTETTTPITPSDSSPVAMSANTGYKPTTNGYAIASQPTSITPSNSSPADITSGGIYRATASGKAVESVTAITPSNSSPVSLSSSGIYKPSSSGYAISSYSSKTPSDTSPASVSSGAIIKASSAGYLYKTQKDHIDFDTPDVTSQGNISANGTISVTVTKTAKLAVFGQANYDNSNGYISVYLIDFSNQSIKQFRYSGSGYTIETPTFSNVVTASSSSSVTFKNTTNIKARAHIAIWY